MKNIIQKDIFPVIGVTAGILLVPFIGMQFSQDVNWTLSDFIIAGVVLFTTGILLDVAIKKAGKYKAAAILAIIVLFIWLWVELAVGLFTTWGS